LEVAWYQYVYPPYFQKGKRLYFDHYEAVDHFNIAQIIQKQHGRRWLVSCDGSPEVLKHYAARRSLFYYLQYNTARAYKGVEIFIFSDNLVLPSFSIVPAIDQTLKECKKSQMVSDYLERF
jgi:DNA adenine methylase